ncbi:alpha/beta fold hydrolase [Flagellimonas sp. DF-77]|uniref:alpha/beta fold hydrolase n=1 Tax=Flagellimonas algarum TaxID=3230298 RepID=UPI00339545BE
MILHAKVLGEGKPLLVLHGFLGMSDNWKTLGNQYAEKGFEVHLIDQRNHGKSFHSEDFDYGFLANDLLTYLQHHNILKANIIGHSMGGKTAMEFACNHGPMVDRLIVADIAPKYYPPHHQEIIDALVAMDIDSVDSRSTADQRLSQRLSNIGIRQFLLKNLYWKEKGRLALRFNLDVLRYRMDEVGENIGSTDSFDGPTLFLRGERSEYILPNDYEGIYRHFPSAQIDTVPKAGHWVHAENPKAFFDKSLEFLLS